MNKLAANIGLGRDYAGVHWRSDTTESLNLGEAVAISILQNVKTTTNRSFAGFSLTKFFSKYSFAGPLAVEGS